MIDAAALLAELKADTKHLGYAGQQVAPLLALLNTRGLSGETCPNTDAPITEVMLAIDMVEWRALPQADRDYLIRVSYLDGVNLADPYVQRQMAAIFPAGGKTLTNLATLEARPCSRAEALFGGGVQVSVNDLNSAAALNGGTL
jgi:hypothetical protein